MAGIRHHRTGVHALGGALAVGVLVLSSCTTLPRDSAPQAIRSFVPTVPTEEQLTPTPGQEPDLLLRDFFTASGKPASRHQAARAFLTDDIKDRWDDTASTVVVDRIDLNAAPGGTADKISYIARGIVVGTLGTGGVYTPEHSSFEATIDLKKVDGQWRIAALPPGIVLERTELRNRYQPQELFFFNPTGKFLVRDRRWVSSEQASLDTALLSLLMEGPSKKLAPGVLSEVPENAVFTGVDAGVYGFTGFENFDSAARHRFAGQVVWTLARAGVPGPYRVELDGSPVDPEHPELAVEDVAEFNPNASAGSISPLYSLSGGSLYQVDGWKRKPVDGFLGTNGQIEAAEISSAQNVVAAVASQGTGDDRRSRLLLGTLGGSMDEVLKARTISCPSFEYGATALWTILDGRIIARIARSTSTGELSQVEVDASDIQAATGSGAHSQAAATTEDPLTSLRLSPSGVRVAYIRDGSVFIATVTRPKPGERSLTAPVDIAPALGKTAVSLDWQQDGSLLVGTSSSDTPVWRVEVDGSTVTNLPSGNLTAPVTAVASSPNSVYVTDARALLQLPINAPSNAFWREVPAFQGTRATPVVAD